MLKNIKLDQTFKKYKVDKHSGFFMATLFFKNMLGLGDNRGNLMIELVQNQK